MDLSSADADFLFTSRGENSFSSRKQNSVGRDFSNPLDCTARVALYIHYQNNMADEMKPAGPPSMIN